MTYINRDPFARTETHRETVRQPSTRQCDWCGTPTYMMKYDRLFRYRTESDGGRVNVHNGLFCSKPCHDAYHSV